MVPNPNLMTDDQIGSIFCYADTVTHAVKYILEGVQLHHTFDMNRYIFESQKR